LRLFSKFAVSETWRHTNHKPMWSEFPALYPLKMWNEPGAGDEGFAKPNKQLVN